MWVSAAGGFRDFCESLLAWEAMELNLGTHVQWAIGHWPLMLLMCLDCCADLRPAPAERQFVWTFGFRLASGPRPQTGRQINAAVGT